MSVVKFRFALVSVLSLVLSVFVPLSTAPATAVDNSFAKTVTVLGANGQPYAGAEVALVSVDNQNQTWVPGTPAITDSSGVAVVTGLTSNTYAALTVEPPVSDSTTAIFTSQIYGVASLDESMTVNLSASNMRVNILTAAGTPAPAGSFVNYPSELVQDLNKTVVTTRTGAFGLAITTKAGQKDAFIGVGGPTDFDSVNRNYALRLAGTGSSATRTLYTDDTFTTVKTPLSSVYQLSLLAEELHGRLKTSSGANLTLPSGVHGRVVFTPANSDGTPNRDFQGPKSKLFNTDGTFTAALPTQKAGKFLSQILLSGSVAFPSFTGPAVWLDATGKYSSTGVTGSYVSASSFVLEVRLPSAQPNLVINAKDSSGAPQPSYIDLVDQSNTFNWWGPNDTTNGVAAFVLPDSTYSFSVTPFSLAEIQSPNYFNVSVASGVASVTDQNGNDVAPNSDGIYVVQSLQPNVKFSILAAAPSNNPLGSGNLQIFDLTWRFINSFGTNNGIVDAKLDDGTYLAEIIPDGNATSANVVYTVTIVNGVATVKDSADQSVTAVNGRFPLHAATPNAVFRVVSPTDQTSDLPQGYINFSRNDGTGDLLSTSGKAAGVKLDEGSVDFDVAGGGIYAQARYTVTKSGSSITVTGPDGPVHATNGVFLLSPAVANVVVRVVNPNDPSKPLTNSFVNVSPADGSYNNGYGTWDQPIAFKLADGDYYFDANSNTPGYASARYSVTVAGGSVTVRNPDGLDVSAVDGIFPISPTTPNVTLKVVDPGTHSAIEGAWLEVHDFQSDQFVSSTGSFHGIANFKLADGKYRIRVHKGANANPQLADSEFVVELTNGTAAVSTKTGSPVTANNGVFEVALGSSNLQVQIKSPVTNSLMTNSYLTLFEIDSNRNYGRFVTNADAFGGTTGLNVADGHYAIEVHPSGSSSLAMSRYELNVSGGGTVFVMKSWAGATVNHENDGSYVLSPEASNLTIKIVDPAHPTQGILGAYVNFQTDNGQWLPGGGVNGAGIGSFKVPAGTYKLQVSPGGIISGLATKTYNLTVASDGTPTITDQANNIVALDQGSGAFILSPAAPNAVFKLVDPSTGAQLRSGFANVFLAQGNDRGRWVAGEGVGRLNFALADGDYIVEVGGSSATEAFANKMYKIHVASGVATFATLANQAIVAGNSGILLAPAAANVKFNIVDPVDASIPLTQAWANVFESVNGNRGNWIANSGGSRAAFSLSDGDYQIEINGGSSISAYASKYVKLHVSGSSATYSTLADVAINPGSDGISLSPSVANVLLSVVDPSTHALLTQSWANIFNRTTNQWVGGSGSNQGLLGFTLGQGLYTVEVNPGGDTNLAQKRYDFEVDSSGAVTFPGKTATQGRFALEATSSNVKLKIVSPSDSTKLLLNAYVNIQRTVDGQWVAGVGGNTGMLSLRLEDGTYNMQLEPGPNVTESLARKNFALTVSGSGTTVAIQGLTADPSTHVFTISPSTPAIKGIVKNPIDDTGVRDSWIEPVNAITGEFLGQFGANSGPNGQFAMSMADGTYKLSAQVPWNSGYNLAKSAPCTVTVANGAVTTNQGGCVQQDHSVVLTLRAPNVSFIVADANGNPLPNANVNIQFGAWNVWSNANSSGRVSLFIDPAEIHAANPTVTGTIHLHASLEPPYGTNSSVRTECNQGSNDAGTLCAKLSPIDLSNPSTPYVSQTIGTVNLAAPNTRLTVTHPDNVAVGAGAWVVLFKENANCPGCRMWLSGSNTGNDGVAAFNVTDTTGFFSVEVNPPYSERGTYAMVTYNHLTWAQVNATFSVASPNLKLTVDQPTTHLAAKWSYVNIETIDSSGNTTGWLPGSGTTEFGKTSLLLPNDGRFKLTIYPGGGSVGTRTTCNVQMTGGAVSLISGACPTGSITSAGQLTVTLSRGNVSGTITHGTGHTPLAGAIVYAERVGGASPAQTFTTGEDGTFGFQLDQGDWTFKVFYVNEPGESIVPELNGVAKTISSQTNSPFEINLAG
jgi:hypothetical protein